MPVRQPAESAIKAKILLVDDNSSGLKARKCVLEEQGYRITMAHGGEEALEAFPRQKFDLVITDYQMPPGMDGIELILRLRQQSPGLPVVLLSGFVDALGLSHDNTGADAVIQKSANEVQHLVRAVARLLAPKSARKPTLGAQPKVKKKAV